MTEADGRAVTEGLAARGPSDGAQDAASGGGHAPSRRIRVIWNTTAGVKAGIPTNSASPDVMQELMARHGLGEDLVPTASEDEAVARTREAVEAGYDVVVAAGGDGTVGTVACQLLGTTTALGVLPLGSVMNIARMVDIPRDLDGGADVIAHGTTRTIDVGEAKGQVFFEAGSVGLNAAIFREAQRVDKGEYGSALRAIWVAVRYRPARMSVRLDHRTIRTRALMVTVANGPYTGIAFTVAPGAELDDGKFDVRLFRGFSKWELARHFLSIALGRRSYHPKVETYRSARVRIESRHPLPCRVDSHDLGTTPVEFTVRKAALRVVVPDAGLPTDAAQVPEASEST